MAHGKSPRHVRGKGARKQAARGKVAPGKQGAGAGTSPAGPDDPGRVDDGAASDAPSPVRLQKLLAAAGLASRRGAEEFLRQGRVSVNGRVAKLGDSADPRYDFVELDGERLVSERLTYWILHKPIGVVTTLSDPEGRSTVLDLLPRGLPRLYPVGRLDVDTSGLLLLTNDGDLAHRLLHPSLGSEREYRVSVRGELTASQRRRLERGMHLDDGPTAPTRIGSLHYDRDADASLLHLVLTEGRKRQVRRSLLVLGHPVRQLVRVRMGPLRLGRLGRGEARPLRGDEIALLREHAAGLRAQPPKRRARRRPSTSGVRTSGKPRDSR